MSEREPQITCDACGADLTYRSNTVEYRLCLKSENKPLKESGFVTAMMEYPAIDRPHHFCDLPCLVKWAAEVEARWTRSKRLVSEDSSA